MTRSILCGLLALLSVGALGVLPLACQSGGIGDPCTPEDEYNTQFAGFKVEQENIESRSFQCATRICLVNHFQGRVSCPQGQDTPTGCNGATDTEDNTCKTKTGNQDAKCIESQTFAPTCNVCDGTDPNCQPSGCPDGLTCTPDANSLVGVCTCTTGSSQTINGVNFVCEYADNCQGDGCPLVLHSYTCHVPNNCQTIAAGTTKDNQDANGKPLDCCIPGSDTPIAVSVCGQCDANSKRNADQAVYCSARCCVPCCAPGQDPSDANPCSNDTSICGPACDPNFNYQSCPSGFTCTGIRTDVGLGDKQLAGAYCIKQGSAYVSDNTCGNVVGHWDNSCKGTPGAAM